MSHVDLTNPDLYEGEVLRAPQQTINVRRIRAIYGHLFERIRIKNYNPTDVTLEIQLRFGADFADIFDVRGMTHRHSGGSHTPTVADSVTEFVQRPDRIRRMTRIRFGVEPDRIDVEDALATAVFRVHLEPYQTRLLVVSVEPILGTEDDRAAPDFDHAVHELRRSYEEWERESTQIVTDNEVFNQLLDRSLRDLRALYTRVGEGGVLAAGIPWYVTIFGRDSLIASHQLLAVNTRPAREALELLAARQGTEENDWRDEQPGKILHEVRDGELARAGIMPHSPYFGSVDSTPWFLILYASTCDGRRREFAAGCSRPPKPRSDGSIGTATWTATGSSSTCLDRPGGSATRGGRTRTTRWSTPTDGSPNHRSPSRRCRGTSTSRRPGWPTCTVRSVGRKTRAVWRTRPSA
jgi:glycogen debranching enzyme